MQDTIPQVNAPNCSEPKEQYIHLFRYSYLDEFGTFKKSSFYTVSPNYATALQELADYVGDRYLIILKQIIRHRIKPSPCCNIPTKYPACILPGLSPSFSPDKLLLNVRSIFC